MENKDVIDIDSENIIGKATQSFYRVLSILKNEFKIFEFLPNKLISYKKLNNAGIIEEDIKRFIENVYNFGREEIFTIKSLKEQGFKDKLEDLGFEDWFYASLLTSDNRFKFKKLMNTILFRKGNEKVTLGDFIENIIVKYKSIDIYDLQNFLVEYYGIETEKYKILENIKDKNLYYNEIMEKAYIDYDRYLEEV